MTDAGWPQRFGSKDALAKIAALRTGLPDTHAYYNVSAFRAGFPSSLALGPRVLKQNRGSQVATRPSLLVVNPFTPSFLPLRNPRPVTRS